MENNEQALSIGQYLASVREKKELKLEDISLATRIKVRLLKKIENDLFDDMGGIGYAKAMILTYSKALGISEDQINELLQSQFSPTIQYVPHDYETQPKKFLVPTKVFSVMLLIIVVALLSYLVVNLYKDGVLTWPPFKKVDTEMQIEPKDKIDADVEDETTRKIPKVEKSDQMVLMENPEDNKAKVVDDSTDHLDELLFKSRKNPYNYDQ